MPDAAGPGMDQHPLALGEPCPVVQRLPGRQQHQRRGGGLDHADGARLGLDELLIDHPILGIVAGRTTQSAVTEPDLVAGLEACHVLADCFDHTGPIAAEYGRQTRVEHRSALADLGIDRIDTGGTESDTYVVRPGQLGLRTLDQPQHLGAAGFLYLNDVHPENPLGSSLAP